MKRFLRITLLLLISTLSGGGYALAEEAANKTYSLTFTDSNKFTANALTKTFDEVDWTIAVDNTSAFSSFDSNKGMHIGTGKQAISSVELSTSGIKGTVTSIIVNASGASGTSATVSVTVGGNAFGETKSLTNSSADYSFTGSAQGDILIKLYQESAKKAIYIKSITVTYAAETGKTATTTTFSGITDGKLELTQGDTFTSPTASVVAGTTALDEATVTYSSSNEAVATVAANGDLTIKSAGTTTIKATYDGDDTYNSSSASYILTVKSLYATIMGLRTALHTTTAEDSIIATLYLTDAIVTYVTGSNAYLQDTSGAILVYLTDNQLKAGQKINGSVSVKARLYNGLAEITSWDASGADVKENATIPDAEVVTLKALTDNYDAYESMRIKVENATVTSAFSKQNGEISQDDGTTYAVRAGSETLTMTKGNVVTIIGFPGIYSKNGSTTYQLNVWSQDDITGFVREDPNLSFPAEEYSVGLNGTFTSPILTAPEGVTVKYASSNTAVATVDESTGAVTPVGQGITTITATSEKNSTYMAGEASYTLAVVDPSITKASFDFSVPATYGYIAPGVSTYTTIDEGKTIVSGVVTITNVKGGTSTTTRFYNTSGTITFRVYKGAQISISAPKGYVITGISSDLDLSSKLTWDSGTVTNKVWAGNANSVTVTATDNVKFSTMTVTYEKAIDVTLDDTQKYTQTEAEGQSVKLNRSFKKGGLGTICLPFDLSADQITAAFGEGTTLYEYTSVTGSTMNFTPVTETTASMPYLVKTAEDKDCLVFESVDISECSPQELMYQNEEGDVYAMQGTFGPIEMTTDGSQLFLTASGELKKPTSTDNKANVIKGFRAFFETTATGSEAKIGFGNMETSVQNIQLFDAATKVYSLNGQLVGSSLKGLSKGVYVVNGKKYIVK